MLKRWVPFAVWLAFVGGVIVFADRGKIRAFLVWVNSWPLGDKAGHVFLIGTLAFLLNHALNERAVKLGRAQLQLGGLLVALAMTCEEISQIWIPSRTFDFGDLAGNYTGVLCAEWAIRQMRKRSKAETRG